MTWSACDEARRLMRQGIWPIPVLRGKKKPSGGKHWEKLRVTEETIDDHFSGEVNVGVLLGDPSGGLIDLDLDCPEAIRLAPSFLPPTERIFGRESRPTSHWLYFVAKGQCGAREKFSDLKRSCIMELRANGCQTVVPPSVLRRDGNQSGNDVEPVVYEKDGKPATVKDFPAAQRFAGRLALACLLVRHYPKPDSRCRHELCLALAGWLMRQPGWSGQDVRQLVHAVANCAGDEEAASRPQEITDTARRLATDQPTYGWPTLAKTLGLPVARVAAEWIGARQGPQGPQEGKKTKKARRREVLESWWQQRELFEFARRICTRLQVDDNETLRAELEEWRRKRCPDVSLEEVWDELLIRVRRVKWPAGLGLPPEAGRLAGNVVLPAEDRRVLGELTYRLFRLAAALQLLAGNGNPFALSCRAAGEYVGLSPMRAYQRMRHLVDLDFLRCVDRGTPGQRGKSATYLLGPRGLRARPNRRHSIIRSGQPDS